MGYRFKKSINLGKGFKINLSQSGVGYSWGIPGFRFYQSAKGQKKCTFSIPGTGISYVKDLSSKNKKSSKTTENKTSEEIQEEQIGNIEIDEASNSDEFINAINSFRKRDKIIKILIILASVILPFLMVNPLIFVIGLIVFGIYIIYRNTCMRINVEYNFDDANAEYYEKLNNFLNEIASSKKLWLIDSRYKNSDTKQNPNTETSLARIPVSITKKLPYYLKTNISANCLTIKDKEFYFLPDKILVQDKNKTAGINFSELSFKFGETAFTEYAAVPKDSEIAGYTYQHTNKKGEPDKRYKNNPKFPKCMYGTIDIKNESLNLSLMLSSKTKTEQAKKYYEELTGLNTKAVKNCINCNQEISIDANFCKHCGTKQ